jgi:hypothetical protein
VHDVIVYAVFNVGRIIFRVEKFALVSFVFREQEFWTAFAVKPTAAVVVVVELDRCDLRKYFLPQPRFAFVQSPAPGVTKPKGRQQMQFGGFRTAVECLNPDQDIVRTALGVFDEDIEIAIPVEDPCVDQFKLEVSLAPCPILLDQPRIGKFGLRVFVKKLHVRVSWRRIEIEIILLDVLPVITFVAG